MVWLTCAPGARHRDQRAAIRASGFPGVSADHDPRGSCIGRRGGQGALSWSMIVLAIGTTMQALPKGPIGSGYLAPRVMTAIYVGPSLEAVRLGGLALMGGMTIFGGAVEP